MPQVRKDRVLDLFSREVVLATGAACGKARYGSHADSFDDHG